MRLLILTQVVDKHHPTLGFFHRWIELFATYAESVTVVCLQKGDYALPHNVQVHSLGKEDGVGRFWYLWNFYTYIIKEREQYDAVFVHMNQVYVLLGALLWKLWNKPIGLWYTHKAVTPSLHLAERFVDYIFTASADSFRLSSDKVHITGHGIDTDLFAPTYHTTAQNRTFTILCIARIGPTKRQYDLVKIVKCLYEHNSDVRLCLVGPVHDEEYLKKIKEYIDSHHVSHVIDIVGPVAYNDIPSLHARARVLVNLSETGSLDKDVLEAMSSNIPVVTTNEAFRSLLPADAVVSTLDDVRVMLEKIIFRKGAVSFRNTILQHHHLDSLISRITSMLQRPITLTTDAVRSLYNTKVPGVFSSEYEYHRWFETPMKHAGYVMTRTIIERYALHEPYASVLELGPGAGTWTKLCLERYPDAEYHLVDISKEMLFLAQEATKTAAHITYTEADFLKFIPEYTVDFFFSSRAIEYIPDRQKTIETIVSLLSSGGRGFIITKMPHYLRGRLLGKRASSFHSGQISPRVLKKLLRAAGCTDIRMYPVTVNFPFWNSVRLSTFLFRLCSRVPLNLLSACVCESYCVMFRKESQV